MLSLFPQILFLAPFSATLLRLASGLVLLLMAWRHYQRRGELANIKFIVIGGGMWVPVFAAVIEMATGIGLVLGIYTQAAALLGAVVAFKSIVWKHCYPDFFPLSRTASTLLLVICLSLVVTGAGVFAFDLPL